MVTTFEEQRSLYNTNIIWGLDPKNEIQLYNLLEYFKDVDFLNEVKKNIIGIKPNLKFYNGKHKELKEILKLFSDKYNILDAKCSDGINTEKSTIDFWNVEGVNAFTIAPASGDELSFMKYLGENGKDTYMMGVMSFPGVIGKMIQGYMLPNENNIKRAVNNGLSGIVMGATAYNEDIDSQLKKIKDGIKNENLEYECLKGYKDRGLEIGIRWRNDEFKSIYNLILANNKLKVLTPGFGRQGGNAEEYFSKIGGVNNHLINAGSDILKSTNKKEIISSKEDILSNLKNMKEKFQKYKK